MRWTLSRTRELGARKRPSVRTPPLAHLPSPRGEPRRLRLRPGASHLYRSRASASLSHTHTKKYKIFGARVVFHFNVFDDYSTIFYHSSSHSPSSPLRLARGDLVLSRVPRPLVHDWSTLRMRARNARVRTPRRSRGSRTRDLALAHRIPSSAPHARQSRRRPVVVVVDEENVV